ncbi:MAG: radical SAM protein [Candidatus Wallbacteria bacterium]|nr:radical SAM protein [Candidatus Wallbacteria bacterium]
MGRDTSSSGFSPPLFPGSILALELTDFCNCNCIMCTQSVSRKIHKRGKGFMSSDLLDSILKSIADSGARFDKLLPFGLGESLLHPAFPELIRRLLDFNSDRSFFSSIDLHTNATLLNEAARAALLNNHSVPDTVSFSLDAIKPETYWRIRRNRQLESAYNNVKSFIDHRESSGKSLPRCLIQFIVMDENKDEAREFLEYWSDFFRTRSLKFQVNYDWFPPMESDTIFFKRLNPFHNEEMADAEELHRSVADGLGLINSSQSDRIISSQEFLDLARPEARRPCAGPFKYLSVSWDGELTVCCIDTSRELSLGNLKQTELFELWNGDKNHAFRMAHILGDLAPMPKCLNCHNLDSPPLSDQEVTTWMRQNGQAELIGRYLERIGK